MVNPGVDDADDRRDLVAGAGAIEIDRADHVDEARSSADLLLGFAQRGGDGVDVAGLAPAAGKGDLAGVARHVLGALREKNRHARCAIDQRHQHRGRLATSPAPARRRSARSRCRSALGARASRMPTGCCSHAPGAQFRQPSCPCSGLNSGLPSIIYPTDTQERLVAPDTSTATDADAQCRPGRHRAAGRPAAGRPRGHRQGHLWPAGRHRSNAGCAPVRRPSAADRRAGPRQDQAGRDAGHRARHGQPSASSSRPT